MISRIPFILLILLTLGCTAEEMVELPVASIADLEISEGITTKEIFVNVLLSKPSEQPVSLTLRTVDGTAEAGSDYEAVDNFILTFEPFDLAESFSITVLGDPAFEQNETFTIEVVSAKNAVAEKDGTVTLINDDTGGLSQVWSDEFDQFNSSNWTYEVNGDGGGNNELQYYTDQNLSIVNGNLIIEARRENYLGKLYTSSRIVTKDKFDFKYGRVDIRAILPKGQGLWPALWMLGDNISEVGWPSCGEIDIMEMIGGSARENEVHGTIHWSDANGGHAQTGASKKLTSGTFNDEFHLFSIIWDQNTIKWYVDDEFTHERDITAGDKSEFHKNFFFIFNVAVGGNWPGSPDGNTTFPQQMIVDYIRVYQEQ